MLLLVLAVTLSVAAPIRPGVVVPYAGDLSTLQGWLLCDGTNHEAALYPDLMAVLGVPNADTFAVPDLQGRSVVARGRRSSGEVGGAESVTLTALQSGHTHMVAALSSMATGPSPRNNLLSFASANKVPFSLDPGTVVIDNVTSIMGNGQPHENMQPFLVLPMIVSTSWTDTLPLGALVAFAGVNVPSGFVLCDGGVAAFPGLAAAFNGLLPDMRSHVALGAGSGVGLTPRNTGDKGGFATTGVSILQLPPHSHSMRMASTVLNRLSADPTSAFVTPDLLTTTGNAVSMDASMLQGSGFATVEHNNLGLSLTTQWVVAVGNATPPIGAMVYYARDLTTVAPGEMRAIGQNLTSARADLMALGLTAAPDTSDAFLMGSSLTDGPNIRLGEEVHFLTSEELPSHTHTFSALTGVRDLTPPTPSSRLGDSDTFNVYAPPSAGMPTVMAATALERSLTTSHENMHPFLVMDVIMFTGEACDAATLPGSVCNCDLLTGVCAAGTTGSAPIVISGNTSYPGDVVLAPSSIVVVNVAGGASLTVNGTVTVNGALTILAPGPGTTTVITAGSIVGQFSSVTVVPQFANCSQVTGTGVYTSTTLTVTVSVPPCDAAGNNGLSTGAIVGIVVGIVGAAIAVAIVGVLIHRHKSNSALHRAKHQIENQQKFSAMKASSL